MGLPALSACEGNGLGWQNSEPACGFRSWVDDCSADVNYFACCLCGGSYLMGDASLLLTCLQNQGASCSPEYSNSSPYKSVDSNFLSIQRYMMSFGRSIALMVHLFDSLPCGKKTQEDRKKTREDIPIPAFSDSRYLCCWRGKAQRSGCSASRRSSWDESLLLVLPAKMGIDFVDNPTRFGSLGCYTSGISLCSRKIIVGVWLQVRFPDGLKEAISSQIPRRGHVGLARVRRGSDDMGCVDRDWRTSLPAIKRSYQLNEEVRHDFPGWVGIYSVHLERCIQVSKIRPSPIRKRRVVA